MNIFTIIIDGLRRRKIRTALAVAGIAIAAASLFSLMTLKQGYETGMRSEIENMGAQIIAVAKGCPYEAVAVIMIGGQVPATLPADVTKDIRKIPNVASASPNVYGAYNYLNLSHPIIGIAKEELALKPWWKIEGKFPENDNEIMLGSVEASVFSEKSGEYKTIGDSITVKAGGKKVALKVVGILKATGSKDDYSTYTMLSTAQKLLNLEGRVVTVNVRVNDIGRIPDTISAIEKISDVQAVTVAQVMGTIQNLVKAAETMLLMVMVIALIIGGIGTANTMMMSVFERTREIGLMKATGASGRQIFALFFTEGLAISLIGGVIGVVLGSAATLGGDMILRNIVSVMPSSSVGKITVDAIAVTLLFPMVIGVLSAVYPAVRAARLNPIDALRNE